MLTYLWKLMHKQRKSANRLSSTWKDILTQSFIARNWIIRNLWQIQLALQEEQLPAECTVRLKNFFLSQLLCICPFLLKKNLIKSRIWHLQKSPTSYSTKGSNFGTSPLGGLYWRGDLTEGFLRYEFEGLIFERGLYMEGFIFGILRYIITFIIIIIIIIVIITPIPSFALCILGPFQTSSYCRVELN